MAVGHRDLQAYLERASRGASASSGQWQGWNFLVFDGATTCIGYEETAGVDAAAEGEVRAPQGCQETAQILRLRRVFAGAGWWWGWGFRYVLVGVVGVVAVAVFCFADFGVGICWRCC